MISPKDDCLHVLWHIDIKTLKNDFSLKGVFKIPYPQGMFHRSLQKHSIIPVWEFSP